MIVDTLYNIALQADYETTRAMLLTHKHFNKIDIWKAKCDSTKPYFDTWTSEVNYLVQTKPAFMLFVNFGEKQNVSEYMYEYNREFFDMWKSISMLDYENTDVGAGYALHQPIIINIENNYLVVGQPDELDEIVIIGQFKNRDDAINAMQSYNNNLWNYSALYFIVDLKLTIPVFIKQHPNTKPQNNNKQWECFYYDNEYNKTRWIEHKRKGYGWHKTD